MAPTAARRARPVQRSSYQGLRGNPDACRPRRGSACDVSEHGAPAEAQRSGFGGESFPAKRRQWRIKRAGKKERRDWRASLARESQCRDGSKGTVEGVSFAACGEANDLKLVPTKRAAMHARFLRANYSPPPPWTLGPGPAGPGGFPTAFDIKSGAPAAQAPAGRPGLHGAGDHRSPLHRRPKLRIVRFRVNAKAHFLRCASFSPRRPLRWVAAGAPLGAPSRRAPRASGSGGKRADTIRPYGLVG